MELSELYFSEVAEIFLLSRVANDKRLLSFGQRESRMTVKSEQERAENDY